MAATKSASYRLDLCEIQGVQNSQSQGVGTERYVLRSISEAGTIETKGGITSIYDFNYNINNSSRRKRAFFTVNTAVSADDDDGAKTFTAVTKDDTPVTGLTFQVNCFTLVAAVSKGATIGNPNTGTTLVYVKGLSVNNSKDYIVYEVASTISAFYTALTT